MVIVFDLDDTLYDEMSYVRSGFRAVSRHLEESYGVASEAVFEMAWSVLLEQGRGAVFDRTLQHFGLLTRRRVAQCVAVYRNHEPQIRLYPQAERALERFAAEHLYLVTDGNKLVQWRKIRALGIAGCFRRLFITRRFGIHREKPSTYCFERIAELEGVPFCEMVCVGDNPRKDFVGIKPLGCRTVRVRTGQYRELDCGMAHEAEFVIDSLNDLNLASMEVFDS